MRGESRSAEPEAARARPLTATAGARAGCPWPRRPQRRVLRPPLLPRWVLAPPAFPSGYAVPQGPPPSTWRARSGRASCESATPRRSRRGGSCSPGAAVARRAGGMIPSRQDCPFASVSYKLTFLFIYSRLSISLGSFAAWQFCGQCWAVLRNMSHAGSESDDAVEADPYARTYIAVAPLCVALSLPSRVYIYIYYI